MAAWSSFLPIARQRLLLNNSQLIKGISQNVTRCMSEDHVMKITASRWQYHKTKDWMHFYVMLGAIPAVLIAICANLFVGPATLQPIPEGYVPKYWEYQRHPISRFIARYLIESPQERYEKMLHVLVRESRVAQHKRLVTEVEDYIMMYGDQQGLTNPRFYGGKYPYIRMQKMIEQNEPIGPEV